MSSDNGLLVRGGTLVDSEGSRRADVLVHGGVVKEVAESIDSPNGYMVLDAGGCVVSPGLVDLHVHLREPGAEDAECIESGARAAALGGFTAVVAMPNTDPPLDNAAVATVVLAKGEGAACQVAVAGAITEGRAGERLSPMAELAGLGVSIFTDDGTGVQSASVMRRAMQYARHLGVVLAQHCEDADLAAGGLMHEGVWSSRLGLPGIPPEAEELMVARDIALCRATGARIHFLHLSTGRSASMVADAKAEGLPVTAEVTPHHLTLTDSELSGYDAIYKVNPPLRCDADVMALRTACASGTIDAIASDHAPHPREAKDTTLDLAAPGMIGLQTALSVAIGSLCTESERPAMSLRDLLAMMSWRPARIAGLSNQGGPLVKGAEANICVFDPTERWEVDPAALASKSHNTPFAGRVLSGKVRHTIYRGEPVVIGGVAQR